MNKVWQFFVSIDRWLVAILLLAIFLRFDGSRPGYNLFHSDEPFIYGNAVEMFLASSIKPDRFDYPATTAIINTFFYRIIFVPLNLGSYYIQHISEIREHSLHFRMSSTEFDHFFKTKILGEREANAIYWSRDITGLFGIGVVLIIYLVAKRLFTKKVGLIASLLTAVNYRQVLNSHLALPDIYNAFFLLLALYTALNLLTNRTTKNFVVAGITAGLSFSIKYQIFSFIPLLLICLFNAFEKRAWSDKFKTFFDWRVLFMPLIGIIVFAIFNPYFFKDWQTAHQQLSYLAIKYRTGKDFLDFYPLSYLYYIGIGQLTSLLVLFGLGIGFYKHLKKTLIVLSLIIPFFFVTIFYTGGGFYTRNFVTITPLLLLFASVGLVQISSIWKTKINIILVGLLLLGLTYENIAKDLILDQEYNKPWNNQLINDFIKNDIPNGSVIAAGSLISIPDSDQKLQYDYNNLFSVDEFRDAGATYAVTNLEAINDRFYWWMTQSTKISLKFWNKPVNILENTYPAMTIRELQSSAIFEAIKPWMAPDTTYIAAKVPRYSSDLLGSPIDFSFNKDTDGWTQSGKLWYGDTNLGLGNDSLSIQKVNTISSPNLGWQSPIVDVTDWPGFTINYTIETSSSNSQAKDGIVVAQFYLNKDDALNSVNRIGVRLSSRNNKLNSWVNKQLVGLVPSVAKFMTIKFIAYPTYSVDPDGYSNIYLKNITIYKSKTAVNYNGWKVTPVNLSSDDLFYFSQSNL